MDSSNMSRPRFVLLMVSLVAGCASVQPLRDPAAFIAKTQPDVVYATHRDGAQLTIAEPRVSGDSLVGIWRPVAQPLALPLSQFRRIEARQRDGTRTGVLIAGTTLAAGAVVFLLTRTTSDIRRPCNADGAYQMNGCDTDDP
jgi:hypothetical protein